MSGRIFGKSNFVIFYHFLLAFSLKCIILLVDYLSIKYKAGWTVNFGHGRAYGKSNKNTGADSLSVLSNPIKPAVCE